MPDIKISQLPEITNDNLNDNDVMPIVDTVAGETKKVSLFELDKRWRALPTGGTINQVLAKLNGNDGAVQWVTINKNYIGLGQVNNTADIDKPLSIQMVDALNEKASKASVLGKADKSYVDTQLANKQNTISNGTEGQVYTMEGGLQIWKAPAGGVSEILYFGGLPNVNGTGRIRMNEGRVVIEVMIDDGWVEFLSAGNPNL